MDGQFSKRWFEIIRKGGGMSPGGVSKRSPVSPRRKLRERPGLSDR